VSTYRARILEKMAVATNADLVRRRAVRVDWVGWGTEKGEGRREDRDSPFSLLPSPIRFSRLTPFSNNSI
jgi:hypothetical protein